MNKSRVDEKFRAEGACRLCRRASSVRPLTRHRVFPGRFGGRYIPINCVPLCRPCHDDVDHKHYVTRMRARKMLRASLWPSEIAAAQTQFVLIGFRFNDFYPPPPRDLVLERRSEYAVAS